MKGEVQQILVEATSDPSWQEKIVDAVQNSVGDHGITALVVLILAGGGYYFYKKKKK